MSDTGPGTAAPMGWRVVSQMPATVAAPNGRAQTGTQITYQLDDGSQHNIFIPAANYTVDGVSRAINDHAKVTSAVARMTGTVTPNPGT